MTATPTPETPAMPPSDHQALEFVRDAINGLRQDVSKVFDRIDDFVDTNTEMHRRIDARLVALEHPVCSCQQDTPSGLLARLPWLPVAWKIGWPAALIFIALWRTAPEPTRRQVHGIAADAAGIKLPDAATGASAQPQITPASTTWSVKQYGGSR